MKPDEPDCIQEAEGCAHPDAHPNTIVQPPQTQAAAPRTNQQDERRDQRAPKAALRYPRVVATTRCLGPIAATNRARAMRNNPADWRSGRSPPPVPPGGGQVDDRDRDGRDRKHIHQKAQGFVTMPCFLGSLLFRTTAGSFVHHHIHHLAGILTSAAIAAYCGATLRSGRPLCRQPLRRRRFSPHFADRGVHRQRILPISGLPNSMVIAPFIFAPDIESIF